MEIDGQPVTRNSQAMRKSHANSDRGRLLLCRLVMLWLQSRGKVETDNDPPAPENPA